MRVLRINRERRYLSLKRKNETPRLDFNDLCVDNDYEYGGVLFPKDISGN